MKKIILAILLVALATSSTHTCGCCCGTVGAPCPSGVGDCNKCPDPSLDVNSKIIVKQPYYIKPPECLYPDVECPQTCPPPTEEPAICVPEIEVDSREVPSVI